MNTIHTNIKNYNNINKYNWNTVPTRETSQNINTVSDCFIRSCSNISFGSNAKLNEKFIGFSKDFVEYMNKNKELKYSDVEKILQKYSPTTTVASMDNVPANSNVCQNTGAYFTNKLNFKPSGKIEIEDKQMFLKLPQNNSEIERLNFMYLTMHEATHIFQEESPDRVSKVTLINDFLKNKPIDANTMSTLQAMPKAFTIAEQNVVFPLLKALGKKDNIPERINSFSPDTLDYIYRNMTGEPSTESYISTIINKTVDYLQGNSPFKLDKIFLKKYIAHTAGKEREAYEKPLPILKHEMGIQGPTDYDLRVMLYNKFENIATKIVNE